MKSRFSVVTFLWSPKGILTVIDPRKRLPHFHKFPGGGVKSQEDSRWDAGGNRESIGIAACREVEEECGPRVTDGDLILVAQEEKSNAHILSYFLGIVPYLHPMKECGNDGEIPSIMTPEEVLVRIHNYEVGERRGVFKDAFMESHGRIAKPIIGRVLSILKSFNENTDPSVTVPEDLVLLAHEERIPGKFGESILHWRSQRIPLVELTR